MAQLSDSPGWIRNDVPMAPRTTLQVGGSADHFVTVTEIEELDSAWKWATERHLPLTLLGEGSNVLFPDEGYRGLVIENRMLGRERQDLEVEVRSGENLPAFIEWLNLQQLGGMEKMYGIPGTVGGAVVGNAGAYGQEICDRVTSATVWSPSEGRQTLTREELGFAYRHSRLKENRQWVLVSCRLQFHSGGRNLQQISDSILKKRLVKYPVGLRCPGSFFKNVIFEELPQEVQRRIPPDFVYYGKVPAGKLLEAVGAKGARRGQAMIADYHGNLLINTGGASSRDLLALAAEYAARVAERYAITLEPEILIVS